MKIIACLFSLVPCRKSCTFLLNFLSNNLICKSFLGTATIQKETNTNSNITAIIQKKTTAMEAHLLLSPVRTRSPVFGHSLCFLQSSFKAEFPITFMLPLASQAHHNLHCSLLILYRASVCVALSSVSFLSSYVKTLLRIRVHMLALNQRAGNLLISIVVRISLFKFSLFSNYL